MRKVFSGFFLSIKSLNYHKETQIPRKTTDRYLDFTLDDYEAAIEVKLCNSKNDKAENDEEINADITVYKARYSYLLFIVYDSGGFIPDKEKFVSAIHTYV